VMLIKDIFARAFLTLKLFTGLVRTNNPNYVKVESFLNLKNSWYPASQSTDTAGPADLTLLPFPVGCIGFLSLKFWLLAESLSRTSPSVVGFMVSAASLTLLMIICNKKP